MIHCILIGKVCLIVNVGLDVSYTKHKVLYMYNVSHEHEREFHVYVPCVFKDNS